MREGVPWGRRKKKRSAQRGKKPKFRKRGMTDER